MRAHKKMHEWNKKHKCPRCSYSSDAKGVVGKHLVNYHREMADSQLEKPNEQPEVAKKYFLLILLQIILLKNSHSGTSGWVGWMSSLSCVWFFHQLIRWSSGSWKDSSTVYTIQLCPLHFSVQYQGRIMGPLKASPRRNICFYIPRKTVGVSYD